MDFNILAQSFLTVISAIIGAATIFLIKLNHEKLCTLISFSAGGLFGAAIFSLIPESLGPLSSIEIGIGILSGYGLFWLLTKYYSHVCPACSASHFDERTAKKFSEIVRSLLIALSIHSFLDGVAISTDQVHKHLFSTTIFIAILSHKLPEGLALASMMYSASYPKSKILIYVLVVEMTTIFGAIAGSLVLKYYVSQVLLGIVMSHIAGGFIFLALHAVLGEMLKNHTKLVITAFSSGLVIILAISKFVH
ncbi:MAG: ZIP family metal transporter [Ignavibacteriaceae bacterium]|nr:ZIP family metal transporter [Ignavibacteriaceae bacterium]